MAPVTLSVSWDDFPNVATSLFKELSTDNVFTDVTLVSEDLQQVRAHRVILAASSTILASILANFTRPDPLLYLKGVQHRQLEALLTFIYQGKAEVEENQLEQFMEAATELGIKGLVKQGDGGQKGEKEAKAEKLKKKQVGKANEEEINVEEDSKDSLVNLRIGEVERVLRNETQNKDTDKELHQKKIKKIKKKKNCSMNKELSKVEQPLLEDSKEALRSALESVANRTDGKPVDDDLIRSEENLVDLVAFEEAQKDNSGQYSCNQCDYKSKNLCGLKRHFISHEGVKFTCMWDGCDQKYTRTDNMKKHMKTCHGIQGDDFGCDKCSMKFNFPEGLKAHIVETHTKKRGKGQK